jgi:hypothetical protein
MKTLESFMPLSNKKADHFRRLIQFFNEPKTETAEMKSIKDNVSSFLTDGKFLDDHTADGVAQIWNNNIIGMKPTMLRKRLLFAAMGYYVELAYNAKISANWDVLADYLTIDALNAIKEAKPKPKRDAKGRFIKA